MILLGVLSALLNFTNQTFQYDLQILLSLIDNNNFFFLGYLSSVLYSILSYNQLQISIFTVVKLLLLSWSLAFGASVVFLHYLQQGSNRVLRPQTKPGRELREVSRVCLLRWGVSWGRGRSEVENTSAVETPINLQSQLCLFRVNSSCVRPGQKHTSAPLNYAHHWQPWCSEMWHL